jgi:hypothetical protein
MSFLERECNWINKNDPLRPLFSHRREIQTSKWENNGSFHGPKQMKMGNNSFIYPGPGWRSTVRRKEMVCLWRESFSSNLSGNG